MYHVKIATWTKPTVEPLPLPVILPYDPDAPDGVPETLPYDPDAPDGVPETLPYDPDAPDGVPETADIRCIWFDGEEYCNVWSWPDPLSITMGDGVDI